MDDIAAFNQERWTELVQRGIVFSRPLLHLDRDSARAEVDPQGILGDVTGKEVLCLASGGGQQSVAFALLGANVTIADLTPAQLEQDRRAAEHYGVAVQIVQCDMRDLSVFADDSFDVVWHAYSINFVPDVAPVFREVRRVLRPGGIYRMQCMNPFFADLEDRHWTGAGYLVSRRYEDGEIAFDDPHWDVEDEAGEMHKVVGPREFCHTLSTIVNSLVNGGFVILGLWEERSAQADPTPGSWEHQKAVAPPWLTFWTRYRG